jgi:tRNA A37 threonylcarbamoyladenosine modification protein TsaB
LRAEPPLILAFDTAAAHCAAALVQGDAVLARRDEPMARGQAERLLPMLEEMLAETRRGWSGLGALAVCTGPGNFTGLRLAVAAARGLAMGLGIPAIGVSRFETLAEGTAGPVRVEVRDPKGDTVVQDFLDGEPLGPPGTGSDTTRDAAETRADPVRLARVAVLRLGRPGQPPAPLYIRPADATPAPEPVVLLLDDA